MEEQGTDQGFERILNVRGTCAPLIMYGENMSYEIKISFLVKTFGREFTRNELVEIISKALWDIDEFRDIFITSFEKDE